MLKEVLALALVALMLVPAVAMMSKEGFDPTGILTNKVSDDGFLSFLEEDSASVNITFWNSENVTNTFHLYRLDRQGWKVGYMWRDMGEFQTGEEIKVIPGLYQVIGTDAIGGIAEYFPGIFMYSELGHRVFLFEEGQRVDLGVML